MLVVLLGFFEKRFHHSRATQQKTITVLGGQPLPWTSGFVRSGPHVVRYVGELEQVAVHAGV
jgi:hypothetical protein